MEILYVCTFAGEIKLLKRIIVPRLRIIAAGQWIFSAQSFLSQNNIDLIFLGPEKTVKKLVDSINEQGLKLRYRVPEDLQLAGSGRSAHFA